ncbi:MAG: hypothetical protein H0U27_06530 [Nitrosopumilus sp.]|nr:hypothetical protein [Nitrosopumilus sp.]
MKRTSENACVYNLSDFLNEDVLMNILDNCAYKDLQITVQVCQLWETTSIKMYKNSCECDLKNFINSLQLKLIKPEKFLKNVVFLITK